MVPGEPYSIVLPICKACIDCGGHIILRSASQNANAKEAKLDTDHAREVLIQENADVGEVSNGVVVGIIFGLEEAQATEYVEEEHRTSTPRHSYLIARASSLMYVDHVLVYSIFYTWRLYVNLFFTYTLYATDFAARGSRGEPNARRQLGHFMVEYV